MAAYIPALLLLLLLFVAPGLAWLSPPLVHTRHTGRHWLGAAVLAVVEEEKVATTTQVEEENSELSSPPWDASFVKARWMMPSIVERALISAPQRGDDDRHNETKIDPLALLDALDMATADRVAAQEALLTTHPVLANVPAVLSVAQCTQLRRFVDNKIKNDDDAVVDNVDGCPDHQVNIHVNKLRKLIGAAALERILAIPVTHLGGDNSTDFSRIGVFLRKYQADGRPWMPFHADGNAYTVNIALTSDDEVVGGRLLALYQQGLHVVPRHTGQATCHAGSVYHAVSAMQAGTRYSLICFLHR